MVGVQRLELWTSCSQSRRATNCATPRYGIFYSFSLYSIAQQQPKRKSKFYLFAKSSRCIHTPGMTYDQCCSSERQIFTLAMVIANTNQNTVMTRG